MPCRHEALLYDRELDYVPLLAPVIGPALRDEAPLFLAAPTERLALLRGAFPLDGRQHVRLFDMRGEGRNPAMSMLKAGAFFSTMAARHGWFVGEPLFPGRTREEVAEVAVNEATVDVAYGDAPLSVFCPYDTGSLSRADLEIAHQTHARVCCAPGAPGCAAPDAGERDPGTVLRAAQQPLPEPAAPVEEAPLSGDLRALRRFLAQHVRGRLDEKRLYGLQLAATEAAANVIEHGELPGLLRVWHEPQRLGCEVRGGGRGADPLLGRRIPSLVGESGRGLWLIQNLCDLVQIRSFDDGTVVRMYQATTRGAERGQAPAAPLPASPTARPCAALDATA